LEYDDALNRIPVYMSKNRNERKKKQRSRGRKRREERKELFLISTAIAVPGLFAAMFFCVEAVATSTSRTLTISTFSHNQRMLIQAAEKKGESSWLARQNPPG
jgi:hypothetical protein